MISNKKSTTKSYISSTTTIFYRPHPRSVKIIKNLNLKIEYSYNT